MGLTLEAIWAPFAGTESNPFSGRTAVEVGEEEIRDNAVELEGTINFDLMTIEESNVWLDAHVDVVDQLSPAETPDAAGTYTHELYLDDASPCSFSFVLVLPLAPLE